MRTRAPDVCRILAGALLAGCAAAPPPGRTLPSELAPSAPPASSEPPSLPPPATPDPAPPPPAASEAPLPPGVERSGQWVIQRSGGRVCVYDPATHVGYGYCGRRYAPRGPRTRIEVAEVSGALDAASAYEGLLQTHDALRGCWLQGSAEQVDLALLVGTTGAPLSTNPLGEGETAGCMAAAMHAAARFPAAKAKTRLKVRLLRVP